MLTSIAGFIRIDSSSSLLLGFSPTFSRRFAERAPDKDGTGAGLAGEFNGREGWLGELSGEIGERGAMDEGYLGWRCWVLG